jgi:hypothetical protein
MRLVDLLHQCLRHFIHLDESNAAIHCAPVRYSPITFRLAQELDAQINSTGESPDDHDLTVARVLAHVGQYDEDSGR